MLVTVNLNVDVVDSQNLTNMQWLGSLFIPELAQIDLN
jgi:hypothetical protein